MFRRFISLFESKPYVEPVFWTKTREARRLGIPCKVTEVEILEALNQADLISADVPLLRSLLPRVDYKVVKE